LPNLILLRCPLRDGRWIGISPIRRYIEFPDRPTPEKFQAQSIEPRDIEILELQSKLKPILDSVAFIGRQCYDVYDEEHQYACEFAETEDAVINRLLHLSNFLNTWEFEGMALGDTGLEGLSNLKEEGKFDTIDRLLRSHLKNLRVYIVGSISIFDIYAVGQAQSGDWLGVSTTAIWT
jgi:Nuclease A inhibitor-like protein